MTHFKSPLTIDKYCISRSNVILPSINTYSKFNSQRQFYTTPNTRIPNNQIEFAEWLYKAPETCKENNEHCLRYNDIRYHNLRY